MKLTLSLSALVVALCACRERDLGTGLNTVEREYSKPIGEVWNATVESVKSADMRIESDSHDELGGQIVARRADNTEVRIDLKALDKNNTKVSVRAGPGDVDMANLIHERVADRLGMGEAKGGLFGGNSLDGEYNNNLQACINAARVCYKALNLTLTNEEVHDTWAHIDGRRDGGTPCRIKCERKKDDDKTYVQFIVGNDKSDDNKLFVDRIKTEFEKALQTGAND